MKLKNKVQIGNTIFNPGIDYEVVISRAEREYKYNHRCCECNVEENLKRLPSGDLLCDECIKCLLD